jgi:hypothetical protein
LTVEYTNSEIMCVVGNIPRALASLYLIIQKVIKCKDGMTDFIGRTEITTGVPSGCLRYKKLKRVSTALKQPTWQNWTQAENHVNLLSAVCSDGYAGK